jgi:hypothetical protein
MSDLTPLDLGAVQAKILEALAEGPLSRSDLHARVTDLQALPHTGWGMDVMGLAFQGRVAVVGRGAEQKFCVLETALDHEAAVEHLAYRYFSSYGPATLKDFSYWTGMSIGELKHAIDALGDRLEAVHVEKLKGVRFVARTTQAATKAPDARLLAKFDPLTMAHADKGLFLEDGHRTAVFRKAGQVEATVMLRGQVAGTWRMATDSKTLSVTVEPLRPIGQRETTQIAREAARLAKAFGKPSSSVEFGAC